MIDFTVLSATLNKDIRPAVVRQMYEKAPAWQLFGGWSAEESVAKRANVGVSRFENNRMYMPIRSSYHSGIVSIQPGEKYQYGSPTLNETYNTISTIVGSFQIQKAVLNTTNKGAIVKPLLFASETLANDLAMDANRQVYGGLGEVGVIATTVSSGSGTTVYLTPSLNGDIDFARYFPPGTNISIDGATGGTPTATQCAVVAQTGDNEITVTPSMSWGASAKVQKMTGSNTESSELAGLYGMVQASGSYQNLDSATAMSWKSYVNATAETLTAASTLPIQLEMHKAYFSANKIGKVDWIITNASLFQVYGRSLTPLVRFGQKEVLAGGWVGLDYMGGMAQVLLDYDCPDDTIYFLSTQDLVFGEFQPLEWEQGTDGVLFKITQQLDYEVTASWMGQLGALARGSQAALRNKTASATS